MFAFPNPLSIMFPGAAGNWQAFDARLLSPNISVNFAGNPTIEREVTEDVASYGTQLGWLNDIVTALAAAAPDTIKADPTAREALGKLHDAMDKIERIKARRKTDAVSEARSALATLGAEDPAGYARLVRSLDPAQPPDAG